MVPPSGNIALLVGYIDPGTGIALAGTVLPLIFGFFATLIAILTWPLRAAWRFTKRRYYGVLPHKVVLLGLDGMDPRLVDTWLAAGKLPHLDALRQQGGYQPLPTTIPPESPVAWSSFLTGHNPGTHGVFDFLVPDFKTYFPHLATGEVENIGSWFILNRLHIPLSRAQVVSYRHGRPFYQELARQGVPVTALRQPMDFPPAGGNARVLASMGVTDVKGRQGDYRIVCAGNAPAHFPQAKVITFNWQDGQAQIALPGPGKADGSPATVDVQLARADGLSLRIGRDTCQLKEHTWTPLMELRFSVGLLRRVPALINFYLISAEPFQLYVSPLMPHPLFPVLPFFRPRSLGKLLWKRQHTFHTLGMAEPTDPFKDGVLDAPAFLQITRQIREEREDMLLDHLDRQRHGLFSIVFDIPDRIQHMFWREMETDDPHYGRIIEQAYLRLDELVGRVRQRLGPEDTLVVFSDHGFASYRRQFHLNRWLVNEGYLTLSAPAPAQFFKGVNWPASRAYGMGFCGLYLNREGREPHGTVKRDEAGTLAREIREKLLALTDPATGERAISAVHLASEVYQGAQAVNAPDLIVGCRRGWRISSASAIGGVAEDIFADNTEQWSGDHCIDPATVPGIIFANRKLPDELTLTSLPSWLTAFFFAQPEPQ